MVRGEGRLVWAWKFTGIVSTVWTPPAERESFFEKEKSPGDCGGGGCIYKKLWPLKATG